MGTRFLSPFIAALKLFVSQKDRGASPRVENDLTKQISDLSGRMTFDLNKCEKAVCKFDSSLSLQINVDFRVLSFVFQKYTFSIGSEGTVKVFFERKEKT